MVDAVPEEGEGFFGRKLGGPETEWTEGGGGDEMVVALDEFFEKLRVGFIECLVKPEGLEEVERVTLFGDPLREGFEDYVTWWHFAVVKL